MLLIGTTIVAFLAALALAKRLFRGPKGWLDLKPLGHEELKKIPFFEKLTVEQLARVEKIIREVRVPAGAYVMREHHVGDALYLVVSGKVNILKRGAHQETLVQTVGTGEFIGEMALLCDLKRIASAQTETAAVLIHVHAEDFVEFMSISGEINDAVWAACDRHAIDLMMRDHERLRTLPLGDRSSWIEARHAEFRGAGETVKVARDGFFALITGSVTMGGKTYEGPVLLPCSAGQEMRTRSRSRLVFLANPWQRRAA